MFLVWVRTVASDTRELARDVRAVEVAVQEAQDLELAFAERLDQRLVDGRRASGASPAAMSRRT